MDGRRPSTGQPEATGRKERGEIAMPAERTADDDPGARGHPPCHRCAAVNRRQDFRAILRGSGWSVSLITGMILVFLIVRAAKAFGFMGFGFLTKQSWIM